MRQKLLLALALTTDASLLILDEPTASLDVDSRRRFFEMVEELPGTPSILLCSHRLEEIRHLVDRVWVLEDGALTYQGEARGYLRRAAECMVEVSTASNDAAIWLDAHGYRRSQAGWWSRAVRNGDRLPVVEATVAAVGSVLDDLIVRDVERIQHREQA